jgi:hypothetical protein
MALRNRDGFGTTHVGNVDNASDQRPAAPPASRRDRRRCLTQQPERKQQFPSWAKGVTDFLGPKERWPLIHSQEEQS